MCGNVFAVSCNKSCEVFIPLPTVKSSLSMSLLWQKWIIVGHILYKKYVRNWVHLDLKFCAVFVIAANIVGIFIYYSKLKFIKVCVLCRLDWIKYLYIKWLTMFYIWNNQLLCLENNVLCVIKLLLLNIYYW